MAQVAVDVRGLCGRSLEFKLDSGAAASICGEKELPKVALRRPDRRLVGPGNTLLECAGMVDATLRYGDKSVVEQVYVIRGQKTNLLSKHACEGLGMLLCTVSSVKAEGACNKLYQGLGSVNREYEICLKENAVSSEIFVPRLVAMPLRAKTKAELRRMQELGVIEQISEPSEWCSPMVVVPEGDKVRICTDFTRLNAYVKRDIPSR